MGGKGSGTSSKRRTLPRKFRVGAISKGDARVRDVRDARAMLAQLHADQGGESEMSAISRAVAERLVFTLTRLHKMEAGAWNGGTLDNATYDSAVGVMLKLADRLGYKRVAKRISLADVLAQHEQETVSAPQQSCTDGIAPSPNTTVDTLPAAGLDSSEDTQ